MSSMILSGDTSGTVTVTVPAVAGTNTITLPAVTGTAVVQGQNSAITAATAQASTSGTSIDFTGIPSWAKRITVMFSGVSTNGASNILIQIGSGSVVTTGYVSQCSYLYTAAAVSSSTAGFFVYYNDANMVTSGSFSLNLISNNTWVCNGCIGTIAGGPVNLLTTGTSSALSGALDRVRITTAGGTNTFDAGTINILYE